MTRFLQFDCVGGASGDMILGALVDLGCDAVRLQRELRKLPLGSFEIRAESTFVRNLRGTRVTVEIHPREARHDAPHGRSFAEIRGLVETADLPAGVREMSKKAFRRLAEAEARVHGVPPDEIHFHEVGAVDSIVDIVGSCLALESLGVGGVAVGPFPQGRGVIRCAHGVFPNPAPATLELLQGQPVTQTEENFELVTPTGAALLTAWKTAGRPPDGSGIVRVGHGFGHFELETRPNLLRAVLLETREATLGPCLLIEFNVDDTVPELIGTLSQRLMGAGALDAYATPVFMKKQRPGTLLSVLCTPAEREALLDIIFRERTTLGVRESAVERTVLERRMESVATPYGPIRVKVARWKDEDVTRSPEMEDCARAADRHHVPVRAVYEAAAAAARDLGDPNEPPRQA